MSRARFKEGWRPTETTAAGMAAVERGERVRITGVARALKDLLTSPVGGHPCLAYRLRVDRAGWRQVLDRSTCTGFLLVDGAVAVKVGGPFRLMIETPYHLDFDNEIQIKLGEAIRGNLSDRERGAPDLDGLADYDTGNYRYFEALLRSGDRVTVEGFASVEVEPSGTRAALREPPLTFALGGNAEAPTILSFPWPMAVPLS